MKLKILLTARATVAVFVHSSSKLMLANLMQIMKQCLMSILSFSRSIHFWEIYFRAKSLLRPIVWKIWKPIFRLLSKCTQYLNYHSIIALQNALNKHEEFSDCFNEDFLNFCRNNCAHCSDFYKLKETIGSVKVKNNPGFKTSKFTLQIYVFVYKMLMDFPLGRFDFDALTT